VNDRYTTREQCGAWQRFNLATLGEDASERRVGERREQAARAESEAPHAAARLEGFRRGYAEGQAQALAEAERLRSIADQLAQTFSLLENKIAEQLLDLALDIARQMLRSDVKVRREALLPVVREAMQCLPDQAQRPQLLLNPADVELVRARIGDELQLNGLGIVEDHRIEPGGCRISATNCEVDATLPARWRRVISALGREVAWSDG
jgi:flagellar assembly protein FliH